MKVYLASVVCGEGDDKSLTPMKIFMVEDEADEFIEQKKKYFDRMVAVRTIAHKLIREWTLANPVPINKAFTRDYNFRLDAETKRAYALVGYLPNSLPNYAEVSYVFRKDLVEA